MEGEADRDHRLVRFLVFTSVGLVPDLAKGFMDGSFELHLENVNTVSDMHQVVGVSVLVGVLCLCR